MKISDIQWLKLISLFIPLTLFITCFNLDLSLSNSENDVQNLYSETINDPDNSYVLTDSNIITLDTIPYIPINIGDILHFYSYSRSWIGGLESRYEGKYVDEVINDVIDSTKTFTLWYTRDKYTAPILIDDSSFTFRCEDNYNSIIDQQDDYNIILNTRYGPLLVFMINAPSTMDGHSYQNIYLKYNDIQTPAGKLLNEFYLKENILIKRNINEYYIRKNK